jgi:hypothetical protein
VSTQPPQEPPEDWEPRPRWGLSDRPTGNELSACQAGEGIGKGAVFLFLLFVWTLVDIVLGVIFLVTRRRPGPRMSADPRGPRGIRLLAILACLLIVAGCSNSGDKRNETEASAVPVESTAATTTTVAPTTTKPRGLGVTQRYSATGTLGHSNLM